MAAMSAGAPLTTSGIKAGAPMDLTGLYTTPVAITDTNRSTVRRQACSMCYHTIHEVMTSLLHLMLLLSVIGTTVEAECPAHPMLHLYAALHQHSGSGFECTHTTWSCSRIIGVQH
jgi:hypothetical protein